MSTFRAIEVPQQVLRHRYGRKGGGDSRDLSDPEREGDHEAANQCPIYN
jgi:hypothetical protein